MDDVCHSPKLGIVRAREIFKTIIWRPAHPAGVSLPLYFTIQTTTCLSVPQGLCEKTVFMSTDFSMHASDSENFYATLPEFVDIDDIANLNCYREAPQDWFIVITDVRGSTAAVAQGRYKEVNTLGAASIISAQNAAAGVELPFVFGGDGATLLVPPSARNAVLSALGFLQKKSLQDFGFILRVGCVPVADVRSDGKSVLVARRRLSEGNCIAMFAGGGLNEATRLVKASDSPYLLPSESEAAGDVSGLECRWCAVPARRDGMLSLILHMPDEHPAGYGELLDALTQIAPEARPITPDNLPDRWPPEFLIHESRMKHTGWLRQRLHYLGVALLTGLLTIIVRKTRRQPESAAARYITSLCRNNDYLKLDDYLRMVIDVSLSQKAQIETLLAQYAVTHGLAWGGHFSSTALFTCMVRSQDSHLHFVDGNDGGYTAAARDMLARTAARGADHDNDKDQACKP